MGRPLGTRAMRGGLLLAGALLSAVAHVGCSLLFDTSSLAGGGTDAEREPDPEVAVDGAADGLPDASASSCDASFCEDFDHGALGAAWSSVSVENGMALSLGPPAVSAPNALRAKVATAIGTPAAFGGLERIVGLGQRISCAVTFQVVARPLKNFSDFLVLRTTGDGIDKYELRFSMAKEGMSGLREDVFFADGGCACPRKFIDVASVAVGRWTRLEIETDFETAMVSLDGSLVTSEPFAGFTPAGPVTVALGLAAFQGETSTEVLFDDVSCVVTR